MEDLKQWSQLRQKYAENLPSAEKRVSFQENWSIRELRNHREQAELKLDRILDSRPVGYEFSSSSSDEEMGRVDTPNFANESENAREETKS